MVFDSQSESFNNNMQRTALRAAAEAERSPALRAGERGRGSGIRLFARRRANKRLEQILRVIK